jgi:hypothetical protein
MEIEDLKKSCSNCAVTDCDGIDETDLYCDDWRLTGKSCANCKWCAVFLCQSPEKCRDMSKWIPKVDKKYEQRKQIISTAKQIAELVTQKQKAYGDSFGKSGDVLRILYPNGVKPEKYGDLLAVTRIIDKLFQIAKEGS